MKCFFPWTLIFAASLTSCGVLGIKQKAAEKEQTSPFGPTGIPPQLRASSGVDGTAVQPGGNSPDRPIMGFTRDEDIIFTDADSPDAAIPELATLLAAPKRGPWEESETVARQISAREGKPLLIWFTDSQGSPMCKAVSEELFATQEFGAWASEKLVRLKVDVEVSREARRDMDTDTAEDYRTRVMAYNTALKKRFKVMGFPSFVMLNPSGEVVGRYRGYKRGESEYLWGQFKHAEAVSATAYASWRKNLENKGYREWRDRNGRKVFAKLTSYSKGSLTLIEPDGTRSKTSESKLSADDQLWIDEQKKRRGME